MENGTTDTDTLYFANQSVSKVIRKNGVWLSPQKLGFSGESLIVTGVSDFYLTNKKQLIHVKSDGPTVVLTLPMDIRGVTVEH